MSWIRTFLLLHAQKQDCGTEDVDDADDPWSDQVSVFLRAEKKALAHVEALPNIIFVVHYEKASKALTVSSSATLLALIVDMFLLSETPGSLRQSDVPPTICPWIAVPSTVPNTSTIIPENNTNIERQHTVKTDT